MSKSSNWFIAATQGPQFTLYAAMKQLGIPLSKEQAECQEYLERKYSEGGKENEVSTTVRPPGKSSQGV